MPLVYEELRRHVKAESDDGGAIKAEGEPAAEGEVRLADQDHKRPQPQEKAGSSNRGTTMSGERPATTASIVSRSSGIAR